MTTPRETSETTETRAQRRGREAAERAEWDRLSAIYFGYWRSVAPHQFHCFCGSLEELRRAVTDIQHRTPSTATREARSFQATDPASATSRARVRAARQHAQRRNDTGDQRRDDCTRDRDGDGDGDGDGE